MTPDKYIDKILEKYRKTPSFPFNDWISNPVSFHALINIWGDVFCAAAGKEKRYYQSLGDAKQEKDSHIYRVINRKERKKFSIAPQNGDEIGGMFYLISNRGESEDGSDDGYDLGFVGDLDRNRLISMFCMIRHYVLKRIKSDKDRKEMREFFVFNYGGFFGFEEYNPFNSPLFLVSKDEGG